MQKSSQGNSYYPLITVFVPIPVGKPRDDTDTYQKSVRSGSTIRTMRMQSMTGLPYGPKARSVLCLMTTHAVRTKNPHIELGTISETMRSLGLPVTGGLRGKIEPVKEQFRRWQGTTVEFREAQPRGGIRAIGFRVVERYVLDWLQDEQYSLIENYAELSAPFVKYMTAPRAVVPVPQDVYLSIGEPIRQDLLVWLSRTLFGMEQGRERERFIPKIALTEQFGPPEMPTKQHLSFMRKIENHLAWLSVNVSGWTGGRLHYEFTTEGLKVKKSALLVEPDDKKAAYVPAEAQEYSESSYLLPETTGGLEVNESAPPFPKPRRRRGRPRKNAPEN